MRVKLLFAPLVGETQLGQAATLSRGETCFSIESLRCSLVVTFVVFLQTFCG